MLVNDHVYGLYDDFGHDDELTEELEATNNDGTRDEGEDASPVREVVGQAKGRQQHSCADRHDYAQVNSGQQQISGQQQQHGCVDRHDYTQVNYGQQHGCADMHGCAQAKSRQQQVNKGFRVATYTETTSVWPYTWLR
ncbi:uncharacterized protein A4U43_C06F17250 [Asparagus officinalis]|uniref:Uncharacterized protein n=1 Tax=Asparagus officinalis TaxID=4686 RepID=A0A5P1EMG7_ASPOF|nr:uncharacterized protein A4U43_C06F17250 [Asparagus officinalis]